MRRAVRQILTLGLLLASTHLLAQTSDLAAPARSATSPNSRVYEYRDGGTLTFVADGARLVAIIGEAVHRFAHGTDLFTNPEATRSRSCVGPVGASSPSKKATRRSHAAQRASRRRCVGCSSRVRKGRMADQPSIATPSEAAGGWHSRGRGGTGIAVGRCGRPTRQRRCRRLLSRVRSILIYHKGALRLEELLRLRP